MDLPGLLAFVKSNGYAAVLGVVVIYVLVRGEITFRYPASSKRRT